MIQNNEGELESLPMNHIFTVLKYHIPEESLHILDFDKQTKSSDLFLHHSLFLRHKRARRSSLTPLSKVRMFLLSISLK